MKLVSDLRGALDRGELLAYFQPQIDVPSGEIVAVEALARWRHPEYGIVAPGVFIPVAEDNGLIGEIGSFMIDEGCRCAAEWMRAGHEIQVSVNVSAAQLVTTEFLDHLRDNLGRLSLPAELLTIEITESLPVVSVPEVTARLLELRGLGLGISLDDFGTGFSTIGQLLELPANEIKLDQSLIQDAGGSGRLMLAVVEMAHDKGLRVVAEGVETESHLAVARELACDRAQGFLLGRPTTEAAIAELL